MKRALVSLQTGYGKNGQLANAAQDDTQERCSVTIGKVFLVGAGPGDPGLLTLRGRDILSTADLVLYDGLANPLLLQLTSGVCERTARTREGSERVVPQQEINERLIAAASQGMKVVRLKGGDPYIFGRGSEEAAALEAAGIQFEIVPGITAATAAGEYAGFSFTHRDVASAVAFVTGHEDPSKASSRLNFNALAAFPGTLVFYMGLGRIRSICEQLVSAGKPGSTPAAVICRASLPSQQTVTSTLARLPEAVESAGLTPPSLIVVGECVSLRTAASWFERRPLFGQSIGITRPEHQCAEIAQRITCLSGQPVLMPLIRIGSIDEQQLAVLDQALAQLETFDWLIFTSVNGVTAFFDRLWSHGKDARCLSDLKIAAIGSSTAAAIEEHSLRPDVVPASFRAEALADAMLPFVNGKRILWARASRGRDVLPTMLTEAGAEVQEVVVYLNEDVDLFPDAIVDLLRNGELSWVGLSSPSIAQQFAKLLQIHDIPSDQLRTKIAAISPVTAKTAIECGLPIAVVATVFTWDGIIDAISQSNC